MIKTHSRIYVILFLLNLLLTNSQAQTPFDTLFRDKAKMGLRDSAYIAKNYLNNPNVPDWLAGSFFDYGHLEYHWKPYIRHEYYEDFSICDVKKDLFRDGYKVVTENGVLFQITLYTNNKSYVISGITISPMRVTGNIILGAYDEKMKFYSTKEKPQYTVKTSYIDSKGSQFMTIFVFINKKDINPLNTILIRELQISKKRPIPLSEMRARERRD